MNETSTVFVSPDGHNNIDLNHLPPLAKGWGWHVYGSGIGQTSTRWVVHTGPVKDGFALCTYRCLTCGYETWHATGLGAHNQKHYRENETGRITQGGAR